MLSNNTHELADISISITQKKLVCQEQQHGKKKKSLEPPKVCDSNYQLYSKETLNHTFEIRLLFLSIWIPQQPKERHENMQK